MNNHFKGLLCRLVIAASALLLASCAPEVGSAKWCMQMKEKPRGEWTINDAGAFAKHCVLYGPRRAGGGRCYQNKCG